MMQREFDGVVFPGQGAQRKDMALDFLNESAGARATFEEASDAIGVDLRAACGDEAMLSRTEYTQPCVLTAEIAMYRSLAEEHGLSPRYFAGHSLGEYAALTAAEVLPFASAVKLAAIRGRLMQWSGFGVMFAVIMHRLPVDEVASVCAPFEVDIANDNSPDQVVISGETGPARAAAAALELRYGDALRMVELQVNVAFHSRHMEESAAAFAKVLAHFSDDVRPAHLNRVASNVSGGFHAGSADELMQSLAKQVRAPVRWRENMDAIRKRSSRILEIGPARTLSGFFRAIGVEVPSITDRRTTRRVFSEVARPLQAEWA